MMDKDFWQEVLQTIRQQKWRSLMTAFGIFWGLLMLMFLIGAGMGFQEGIVGQLKQMPANSVAYSTDVTTMAYNGFERGRSWSIDFKDVEAIQAKYPGSIKQAIYVKYLPAANSTLIVSSRSATDELTVAGVSPFLSVCRHSESLPVDISTNLIATSGEKCASSELKLPGRFSQMTTPL